MFFPIISTHLKNLTSIHSISYLSVQMHSFEARRLKLCVVCELKWAHSGWPRRSPRPMEPLVLYRGFTEGVLLLSQWLVVQKIEFLHSGWFKNTVYCFKEVLIEVTWDQLHSYNCYVCSFDKLKVLQVWKGDEHSTFFTNDEKLDLLWWCNSKA